MYFVYDRNKGMAVPTPIFTILKNTQEHYIHISYTEFYSNRALNIETTNRNSFGKTLQISARNNNFIIFNLIKYATRFGHI